MVVNETVNNGIMIVGILLYVLLGCTGFSWVVSFMTILVLLLFVEMNVFFKMLFFAVFACMMIKLLRLLFLPSTYYYTYPLVVLIVMVKSLKSHVFFDWFYSDRVVVLTVVAFITTVFYIYYDYDRLAFLGYFLDRNVFALTLLPLILYITYSFKFGFILGLLFALVTGSRNPVLSVLIMFILLHFRFVNGFLKERMALSFAVSIVLPVAGLLLSYHYSYLIDVADGRVFFSLFDASNSERAKALHSAVDFLYSYPEYFFLGGGWGVYSDLYDTRVHNDFFNYLIKHGVIVTGMSCYMLLTIYKKINTPSCIVICYVIFSSILGGVFWGFGFYWVGCSLLLFNGRASELTR